MATRSLTSLFKELRDGARRRGDDYIVPLDDPSTSLTNGRMRDEEEIDAWRRSSKVAPEWLNRINPIHEAMAFIKNKMEDLKRLYESVLTTSIERKTEEEHQIEIITSRVTSLFQKCKTDIKFLGAGLQLSPDQEIMKKNIQSMLAQQLSDLSQSFRKQQNDYLNELRKHAQMRARLPKLQGETTQYSDDEGDETAFYDTGFTADQIQMTNMSRRQIEQREREVREIAKSVHELAVIFQDLASLVQEQGTYLDQIEYNINQAKERAKEAKEELVAAATSQGSARNKYCVLLLIIVIFGTIISLILFYRG